MIYGKNGLALNSCFSQSGLPLQNAYDLNGNTVFPSEPLSLKVMTYNCGEWYTGGGDNVPAEKDSDYYALQNGMIQQNNPDVLCIQEYWKIFSKTGRTAIPMLQQYFPYIQEEGGDSGYFGHCICSKYPITNYTVRKYSGEQNRYYDSCTITVNGIEITVINTHFDTTLAKREAELPELISFLQSQNRFIACGDFNTIHCLDDTGEDYTAIIVPLLNAGFHVVNCSTLGFMQTYRDEGTGYVGVLDNIVTSSNIQIVSAHVDETKLNDQLSDKTDHMPLIANLSIEV